MTICIERTASFLTWSLFKRSRRYVPNTEDIRKSVLTYLQQLRDRTLRFGNQYVTCLHTILCDLFGTDPHQMYANNRSSTSVNASNALEPKTYMDRLTSGDFEHNRMKRRSIDTHKGVCICMIDIVNFTQWSTDRHPEDIFETMSTYNEFIVNSIDPVSDVEKIEMVGDSIMVIGGLRSGCTRNTVFDMFLFVSTVLNRVHRIKTMFSDSSISLRVGMHIGDVFIGCVTGPTRMQLFGNAICVASRMESNAYSGTLMISETLFDHIEHHKEQLAKLATGTVVIVDCKGVGKVKCMCVFPRATNLNVLIADDLVVSTNSIGQKIKQLTQDANVKQVNTLHDLKEALFMHPYDLILTDVHFQNGETVNTLLHEYKTFEEKCRLQPSRIVVFSSSFEQTDGSDRFGSLVDSNDIIPRTRVFKHVDSIFKQAPPTDVMETSGGEGTVTKCPVGENP